MRKKKLEEINPRESDIYVECSLHINERDVSKWGYNLSLFGKYVYVDGEMNAEDIRLLVRSLTAALKVTGEWKKKGGTK